MGLISTIGLVGFLGASFGTLAKAALDDWRSGMVHDKVFVTGSALMVLFGLMYQGLPFLGNMVGLGALAYMVGAFSVLLGAMYGADVWGIIIYSVSALALNLPLMIVSYAVVTPLYRIYYQRKFGGGEREEDGEGIRILPAFFLAWILGALLSFLL